MELITQINLLSYVTNSSRLYVDKLLQSAEHIELLVLVQI